MSEKFEHSQFAHCESGVVSTLLTHYGLKMSEPMAFGITSSLSFVFLPIIKLNNMPLIAYRAVPKNIINKISKIFGIEMVKKTYKNAIDANNDLTKFVEDKQLVGLQTSVFYLPYFPKDMRFHFNAHNLLVFGKEGENYNISDPVFEEAVLCNEQDLTRARFAKGVFAPKGFMYYPKNIPSNFDFESIVKKAIKKNAKSMLTPFPYAGVKGMRTLAKKISKLNPNSDSRYLKNYLTHIVRMQEEIGTGGGGFRFLYAAFLKEVKQYNLDNEILEEAASLLVKSGNTLREFALLCVESSKKIDKFDPNKIAKKLVEASSYEEEAFKLLKKI
ncbi:BtrH N-terminal domain-containing protein [Halarcobacter sp.]|uniref:BtrH N-terminal domain-containing protein n=1 Tax=Halarcobacter sp. TaxID=2321133 RepID=UPI003A92CF6C